MKGNRITIIASLGAVCLLACNSAFADDNKTQVKGMIMSRTGETLIVSGKGGKATVVLTEDTRTKDDKGLFGLQKEEMSETVLVPGLKVKVDGTSTSDGRITAKTITVDGDDLEMAEMIQAGLHPTAEQVAANMQTLEAHQKGIEGNQQDIGKNRENIANNQQNIAANKGNVEQNRQQIQESIKDIEEHTTRFNQLAEYDVKGDETLRFQVGSSTVSPEDEAKLKQLAETAKGITGYIVEVKGFADSTGAAMMNEQLSEDRAKRVVAYLVQHCGIPVRHVVAPGAIGEFQPVSSNESSDGRADNRRVEVKILVNKGITGS